MMMLWLSLGGGMSLTAYLVYRSWQARKEYAVLVESQIERTVIAEETDEFGVIRVIEIGAYRYLEFGDSFEQSCVLYDNPLYLKYDYTRAMLLASLCHEHPETALFLGLGAGSLTEVCLATLPLEDVEVLELRAPLPRMAMEHMAMTDDPRLTIRIGDALELIETAETADLIYLDMYTDLGPSAGIWRGGFNSMSKQTEPWRLADYQSVGYVRWQSLGSGFFAGIVLSTLLGNPCQRGQCDYSCALQF